jgi:ADP-ribosylation factor GTPase-activating protein 1
MVAVQAAVDPEAADFFRRQMVDPENTVCCDSGAVEATWVSISHGIYLSIGAAGLHRSLGVNVSFVQSTIMDSWKPKHLKMMELGGNRRFNDFLREHGIPLDMPVREKYSTRAAEWYRRNLRALAEGSEPLAPLPHGTGHLPMEACSSSMRHVLDEVFAESPCHGSMSAGGVARQTHLCPEPSVIVEEDATEFTSRHICRKLSACFRFKWSSKTAQLSSSDESEESKLVTSSMSPDIPPDALPSLLTSSPWRHAKDQIAAAAA